MKIQAQRLLNLESEIKVCIIMEMHGTTEKDSYMYTFYINK